MPPGVQRAQGLGLVSVQRETHYRARDGSTTNLGQFNKSLEAGQKKKGLLQEQRGQRRVFPVGQGSCHLVKTLPRAPCPGQGRLDESSREQLSPAEPKAPVSSLPEELRCAPRLKRRRHSISAGVPATPGYRRRL